MLQDRLWPSTCCSYEVRRCVQNKPNCCPRGWGRFAVQTDASPQSSAELRRSFCCRVARPPIMSPAERPAGRWAQALLCTAALFTLSFCAQLALCCTVRRAVQEMLQGRFSLHVMSAVCCLASLGQPAPDRQTETQG